MRRVTILLISLPILLVALWGVVTATPETAPALQGSQPQVNLWMSTNPQGSPAVSFPSRSQVIYAVMEYSNLSSQSVRVTVIDDGKIILLDDEAPYNGSGRRVFSITGSSMLAAYLEDIETHGQNMTMKIAEAVQYVRPGAAITETLSITPTVQAAVTEANSMRSGLQRVRDRFPHSSETDTHIGMAVSALDQVITAGEEAVEAGRTLEEMRTRVNTMATRGAEAVEHARKARYGDRSGRPHSIFLPWVAKNPTTGLASSFDIPETPSCQANTSNLYIGSRPAATVEWTVGDPGSPKNVEVIASPSSIYAKSVVVPGVTITNEARIKAVVTDAKCRPVRDGLTVQFATNDPALGTVSPTSARTFTTSAGQPGVAETTLTAGSQVGEGVIVVTATVDSAVGVEQVTLVGPATSVQVRVSRKYMEAGKEASLVVADVRDAHNWPAVDGTPVTFSVTPSGFGNWSEPTARTRDGLASSYLNPGLTTGSATVMASIDGVQSEPVDVWIVGPAETITVTAEPATIYTTLPSAFSQITASARDAAGNPAADGTKIRFRIYQESLGGFQDGDPGCGYCRVDVPLSNGVATARLFAKGSPGEAEVEACVLDPRGRCDVAEFTLVLFIGPPANVSVTADPTGIPVGGATSTIAASVTDALGNPVVDGTAVRFSTDLGTVNPLTTTTTAGVAVTTLTSGADPGTATVTAQAGSAVGMTSVTFASVRRTGAATSAQGRLPDWNRVVGSAREWVSRPVVFLSRLTFAGLRVEG